jgi:hypothetical protein
MMLLKSTVLFFYDTDTEQTLVFNDQSFEERTTQRPATEPVVSGYPNSWKMRPTIVGHNIINYDLAVINKALSMV